MALKHRCPGSNQLPRKHTPWAMFCGTCDRVWIEGHHLAGKYTPIHYVPVEPVDDTLPEWMTRQRSDGENALLAGTYDWKPVDETPVAPAPVAVDYHPRTRLTPLSGAYGYSEFLTPDGYNPKTKKGRARGYSTAIWHGAPGNLSGYEVCNHRSPGCTHDCLNLSGHGAIGLDVNAAVDLVTNTNEIQSARIKRTHLLFQQRDVFFAELVLAIETHCRRALAHGLIPVVRMNGTSDLPWERMPFTDVDGTRYATIFDRFPNVQFYDYTKSPSRAMLYAFGKMPANYALTFSRSETNESVALDVLRNGGNVAVVFNAKTATHGAHAKPAEPLPAFWHGFRVVDGDHDDLRFLDDVNVVVGLRAKGPRAKHDTSGFVVDVASSACSSLPAGAPIRMILDLDRAA